VRHLPIRFRYLDKTPDITAIRAAASRIAQEAVVTPLLFSAAINEILGVRALFKAENLQRTGSFKFRGALNALAMLPEKQKHKGVVACSSGNHAQGVAEAARILDIEATIIIPDDAPSVKLARTRRSGANIITYDRMTEDRDALAAAFQRDTGAHLVHPYNDPDVIAGQGSCGLEIADQLTQMNIQPDRLLVCTGGGGLTAGVSLAMHDRFPDLTIHSVEPEGFDDYRRSLIAGKPLMNSLRGGSACDALLSESPGEIGFSINRNHLSQGIVISDEEAFNAMRFAFSELKLVLEPGGAAALAALLQNAASWQGETVGCILTGGNVDSNTFRQALSNEGKSLRQPHNAEDGGETTDVE
jgi:threonine dehydratase